MTSSELEAQTAADYFFLDLGGAAEDRPDAAGPPEVTVVPQGSGLVLTSVRAGLRLVSASRGVRAARSGRR